MRAPDQPTFARAFKLGAREILPVFGVAMGGIAVLMVIFVMVMSPAGMQGHDFAMVFRLTALIIALVAPAMYLGTVIEVYHRETPMMREARERVQLAKLKNKYER